MSLRFKATSSIGCCRVLTLSGTTITVGARQSFITTGQANQGAIAYDTTSETVVIAFRDEANTTYGSIVAGSVSGDTITYGSLLTFQSGSIDWLGIRGFASGGGVILAYDNNSSSPTNVPVKYFYYFWNNYNLSKHRHFLLWRWCRQQILWVC